MAAPARKNRRASASPRPRAGLAPRVRAGRPDDAPKFAKLVGALARETPFLLRTPGERLPRPDMLQRNLAAGLRRRNYAFFVAEAGDALVGFCEVYGNVFRRLAHRGLIVIGVRAAHTGNGLGTAMLRAAERWARRRGLRRLELDVSIRNRRAHRLYRRLGFVEEGRRRDTWVIGGRFFDDIIMSKLLPGKRARRWPKGVQ